MTEKEHILHLVTNNSDRMQALCAVAALNLPDWYIAAGFVRNLIWDALHRTSSSLNDVDVIYFCKNDCSRERDINLEERLLDAKPTIPWSVKNQARMHSKNNHQAYNNCKQAMSYWPEKQTAIGIRLENNGELRLCHCFPLRFQFNLQITKNHKSSKELFLQRIKAKQWLAVYPKLTISMH